MFTFQFAMMNRTYFLVLYLEGLVGLHGTGQLQLLQHQWLGRRLGLLMLNGLPWKQTEVILEIAPKYCSFFMRLPC